MVTFVPHAARLVLTPPAEGGGAQLKQVDRDGAESARTVAADELNGVSIRVDDGSIAWSAVGTDAEPSDSVLAGAALG
jgi:hypothetical protein